MKIAAQSMIQFPHHLENIKEENNSSNDSKMNSKRRQKENINSVNGSKKSKKSIKNATNIFALKHGLGAPVLNKYSLFNLMVNNTQSGARSQINQPIRQIRKAKAKPTNSNHRSNFTTTSNLSTGSFFQLANMQSLQGNLLVKAIRLEKDRLDQETMKDVDIN